MPHINQLDRLKFVELEHLNVMESKGELEYCVARLMVKYMRTGNRQMRYSDLHDCCKAVQHCAHEFERLYLDKREDDAIAENTSAFEGLDYNDM